MLFYDFLLVSPSELSLVHFRKNEFIYIFFSLNLPMEMYQPPSLTCRNNNKSMKDTNDYVQFF